MVLSVTLAPLQKLHRPTQDGASWLIWLMRWDDKNRTPFSSSTIFLRIRSLKRFVKACCRVWNITWKEKKREREKNPSFSVGGSTKNQSQGFFHAGMEREIEALEKQHLGYYRKIVKSPRYKLCSGYPHWSMLIICATWVYFRTTSHHWMSEQSSCTFKRLPLYSNVTLVLVLRTPIHGNGTEASLNSSRNLQ